MTAEECHNLQSLRDFKISQNNIQSLPLWIYKLEKLEFLDLRSNDNLLKIESAVQEMKSLIRLDCGGCENLKEPPYSVCQQGIAAIKKFFVDFAADKPVKLVEVPIAVIGNTMSGKTSLFRTLKAGKRTLTFRNERSEKDETTRVFKVEDLPLEDTQIKLFDYGGNHAYHLAYHILSKERCVPLIVVDVADFAKRAQADGSEEACRTVCFDWLSHLYLASPKLGAPILVLTHTDELSSDQLSQAREDLLTTCESIRGKLSDEENSLESLFPKTLIHIQHLSDRQLPLFDTGDIFEFGNDLDETSNIEHLKEKLNDRCKQHIIELPKLWNSVELFIQQCSEQPYVEVSTVLAEFPVDEPLIILRYMHNAGRVFFFENIEALSHIIFHKFTEITSMINMLFHHSSQQHWDNHLSKFVSFTHNGRAIHKLEYEEMIHRLLHDGILAEALLHNLLKSSPFSMAVSVELLRSFLMMHGPIGQLSYKEYLVPALACESIKSLFKMESPLKLKLDIMFGGLAVPNYVHHQISVTVLNLLKSPLHESSAQKNGVTISHGNIVTNVVHDLHKRVTSLQIATTTQELGKSWQLLIDATKAIVHQLSHSWKACSVTFRIYCSHCLFIADHQPDSQVNPEWLNLTPELNRGQIKVEPSLFSGIEPVLCKRYSPSPVQVPTPLRFPCFQLTDKEITKLDKYLQTLKPFQASSTDDEQRHSLKDLGVDEGVSPVPLTALNEDSDLSDVEKEGYCDHKSSADIILRLRRVNKKRVKDLYNNEEKVLRHI
ncbi:malignant fibrous histiocytoma-amplified sequence 1 homolog [Watersipora subatra]|uniref:malignant fibrous histiocytoma-amplified sequence 1 homolog n=1 Tax=Watersipora subatra TaxID=2589382 RepID=UPI00355C0FB1